MTKNDNMCINTRNNNANKEFFDKQKCMKTVVACFKLKNKYIKDRLPMQYVNFDIQRQGDNSTIFKQTVHAIAQKNTKPKLALTVIFFFKLDLVDSSPVSFYKAMGVFYYTVQVFRIRLLKAGYCCLGE